MAQSFNLTARINLQGPYNLRPIISKIKKDIGGIKPELKFKLDPAAAKSVKNVTAEIKKLDAAAKSAKKSVGSLNSQLMTLSASFNSAATASKNAANATNAATRATANAAKTANQARTAIEEFGKQSGLAIKRFAAFTSVTTVIYGVTNAITDAYKEFLVFNKELVRLSQVTNKSVGDLQGISNEITRLSTSLGVTSTDLISVASTLAQAGLSAQDTKIALEALAKSALAPSFENITQTTEGAIAAIRQFGLQTGELDSALGSINAVAAAFAVEAGDIIAAIQRTGGVFASASRGVSEGTDALNEFIAIFTSVRQTTRESAETIATGLRTIFTRIQRADTIELLKQYGVELRDLEGKFVGPFEAVKRLSEGLSKIDPRSADFARISEELGGFRQIGKVIPLIQQFAVAQDALNVAQQGSGSLTKDVITAQQSLAVQFEKTRQNFLALIREIGDSNSFKVFVGSTLVFTNALIDLGRVLKPLLPLLLTFTAIKAGSGLNQFLSGFGLAFGGNRGGGSAGGAGGGGTPPTGGGGGGSGGNQPLTSALALNVTATNSLVQAVTTLNTSVVALNQNLLNRPSPPGFATGGLVPGTGNRDTVPARLMPGEFVIRKRAVEAIGAENLAQMNNGGIVQKFGIGTKGRGVKIKRGRRSGFKPLTEKEIVQLSTQELIDYVNSQALEDYVYSGGAGLVTGREFISVPPERIIPEIADDLITGPDGSKGFWREKISPIGSAARERQRKEGKVSSRTLRNFAKAGIEAENVEAANQAIEAMTIQEIQKAFSGVKKAPPGQRDIAAARYESDPMFQQLMSAGPTLALFKELGGEKDISGLLESLGPASTLSSLKSFRASLASELSQVKDDPKLAKKIQAKIDKADKAVQDFEKYLKGSFAENPGRASAFSWAMRQSGAIELANGGFVRKYMNGSPSGVKPKTEKEEIDEILTEIFGSQFKGTYIDGTTANIPVRSLKTGKLPQKTGNISKKKLDEARDKIKDVMTKRSLVQAQKKEAFDKKRQDLIDSGKIFKFGLAGLRFGTTAQDKWTGEIPPSFVGLESVRETDQGIPVQIFAGALSNQLKEGEAQKLEEEIIKDFVKSVEKVSANLGSRIKASPISDPDEITKRIQNAGISNVVGAALEAGISLLGAPYVQKDEKTKSIDFPAGLGASASLFGLRSDIPTDVTRTIGSPGKGITDYLKQIGRFLDSPFASYAKYATGGSVKDTVPALLTPGEFVFSEPAAKRIGYGNLNRMNKVQGFNKGGVVGGPQKFAAGGSVTSDPAAIVAALTGILIPQVQRLAETFGKLQGDIGTFGTALQGIVRETSSIILSTSIGLRAVGASETTIRRAQIGGGLAAAVGGGITDVSSKLLDKALQENTKAISSFDKSLQDYANAATEELKIESAKKVEENFRALDTTLKNTKDNIDRLENLKNFGQSINNVTLTILTTVTAMSALAQASARASAAVAASKLPGAFVTGAAAVSTSTRLLASFGKAIPVIGTVISLLSIGAEAFSFFNTKLKSTDDQFTRLNSALRETIKISNDYNLANENFINNILPQFRKLTAEKPGQTTEISRQIGSLSENSLNLTRNFLIKQFARQQGLDIGTTETIDEAQQRVSGFPNLERVLTSSIEQANQRYIIEGFAAAMRERGLTDPAAISAEAEKLGGLDAKKVQQIAIDYFGELDRRLLAERDLAQASSELKVNMINLSNTVDNLESIFNRSLSDLQINFNNLNRNIDILVGDIKVQTSTVLEKNIQILENLKQSTPQEISRALSSVQLSLGPRYDKVLPFKLDANISPEDIRNLQPQGIESQLTDQTKVFGQIADAVQSNAILQQRTDIVLNKISQLGLQGDLAKEVLNEELKGILISSLGGGPGAEDKATTLINELAAALQAGGTEGKPITTFQEAASRVEGFGSLLSELGNVTKSVVAITKIRQQAEQALVDSINRELELRSKFTELSIQRSQTEVRNNVSLKRALGQRVSLEEINEEFLTQIRQLTTGTPGLSLSGGQITANEVNLIADELAKARTEIARRESQVGESGKLALQTDLSFRLLVDKTNRLNKAMQEVANSGTLVNNTFEEISKQKDLLKSQEQLLFDLIRDSGDPLKSAEINRIVAAVVAVNRGTATRRQAELAVEKGVPLVTARRGQEAGEVFRRNAMMMFFNQTASLARTPEEVVTSQQVLNDLVEAFADIAEPAKTATEAQTAAQERLMQPVKESIDLTLKNTEEIFGNFNTDIKTRFEALLQTLRDIEGRVQSQPSIKQTESIPENILDKVRTAVIGLGENITNAPGINASAIRLLNPEEVQDILSELSKGASAANEALNKIPSMVKRNTDPSFVARLNPFDIQQSEGVVKFQEKRLLEAIRVFSELTDVISNRSVPQNNNRPPVREQLNIGPGLNQGSFLDPSSKRTLDGFSTTTKDLATALTGENNTITQLAEAVRTLTPVINTFKTAAEALASKIGPDGTITINQTAQSNVSVSFDEALQVDVPLDNRGNNAIVDNIRTIIQNEISGLRREIGLA